MYSAHSLLRPQLSVIYPYTTHHLVLFKLPGDATPPRQFSAEAADRPACKTIIFGFKRGSQHMLPKVTWQEEAFHGKSLMSMALEHAGEVTVCKAPCSTYKHPAHPKSRDARTIQALAGGIALAPSTRWQHWGATCDPRLAVQARHCSQTAPPTTGNTC